MLCFGLIIWLDLKALLTNEHELATMFLYWECFGRERLLGTNASDRLCGLGSFRQLFAFLATFSLASNLTFLL